MWVLAAAPGGYLGNAYKKMEQIEFYVTEGNTPAPLFSETRLEPYGGPQQGSVNTTYTKFNVGHVPASKFQIAVFCYNN